MDLFELRKKHFNFNNTIFLTKFSCTKMDIINNKVLIFTNLSLQKKKENNLI